ncbi:MAG TPA: hypothetical protein VJ890_20285, partial [Vineibacter sp.]|nr:hypothetical protein [Vineibacter sp.]
NMAVLPSDIASRYAVSTGDAVPGQRRTGGHFIVRTFARILASHRRHVPWSFSPFAWECQRAQNAGIASRRMAQSLATLVATTATPSSIAKSATGHQLAARSFLA